MGKKIAQYTIIENDLRENIAEGYYKIGDNIPTEHELIKIYKVSRVTVRKALDNLATQGLIDRISGVGTFVKSANVLQKVSTILGFTKEISEAGMTPRTEVKTFEIIEVPNKYYRLLGITSNEMVYRIERYRYADDKLFIIENTHMSVCLYPGISVKVLQGSKYEYFEKELGLRVSYSEQTVTPILPSDSVAKLFGISKETPVIRVGNKTVLDNGNVMDYTEQIMNSPSYHLRYIKQ